MTQPFHHLFTVLLLATSLTSCGQNLFKSGETEDPAEDAVLALEKDDPSSAIKILEEALKNDPDNPKYLSILALAKAQKAGIEPLLFAKGMSEKSTDEKASNKGGFSSMFAIMPDATTENIRLINEAVNILGTQIAPPNRQPGDPFKLAMYQTAAVVLQTKALDADLDGSISPTEIINLEDASAEELLNQISAAKTILATSDPNDQAAQQAAQAIAKFEQDIDTMPGETDEEKFKNFIAARQAQGENTEDVGDVEGATSGALSPSF